MSDAQDFNTQIIDEFRANDGKVGGMFEHMPIVLLHTIGSKTGAERVHPVVYQEVGDSIAVFGSYAGGPVHPAWFHNMVANPNLTIELGSETLDVTARVAEGDERARIWQIQKDTAPGFAEYEAATDREIPVVVLDRR